MVVSNTDESWSLQAHGAHRLATVCAKLQDASSAAPPSA
jgi:hypothetical protein